MRWSRPCAILVSCGIVLGSAAPAGAQAAVDRARDRGQGVSSSMFGIYIDKGELFVYPFFEYYRDSDYEYEPLELGYGDPTEHRGRYRAKEGLLFIGYGLSKNVVAEFEVAGISATLDKSSIDTSRLPARVEESGLGDVEGQIRWRWRPETDTRPELFSYFETVFPSQDEHSLIGTSVWEFKLGFGVIRGLRWGTITARAAVANSGGSFEPGEYAFEYLRRVNRRLRVFGAVEGSEDEVELIAEAQVFLTPNVVLKLNNAFGLTSKATDWAPEIGLMIAFR
jgi:hypothetical protein